MRTIFIVWYKAIDVYFFINLVIGNQQHWVISVCHAVCKKLGHICVKAYRSLVYVMVRSLANGVVNDNL